MVPLCNPAGDRTLCRVSMTSRTRENQTHKLSPNLRAPFQGIITAQNKTGLCGGLVLSTVGMNLFISTVIRSCPWTPALGLCSFLNNSSSSSCWCRQLSERNAAPVGSSAISAGTQLELKLRCGCSGKGHPIFTDDPLPNTAGSFF